MPMPCCIQRSQLAHWHIGKLAHYYSDQNLISRTLQTNIQKKKGSSVYHETAFNSKFFICYFLGAEVYLAFKPSIISCVILNELSA